MADRCRVRVATEADLGGIVAIEQEAFSDPWPRESFHRLLRQLALVADDGDRVVGYILASSRTGTVQRARSSTSRFTLSSGVAASRAGWWRRPSSG